MHDAVDTGDRPVDLRHAGEIGLDEGLIGGKLGRAPEVA